MLLQALKIRITFGRHEPERPIRYRDNQRRRVLSRQNSVSFQSLELGEQIEDLSWRVGFKKSFAEVRIADGRGELREDLEIFRLAIVRATDHENDPDGGGVESVPIDPFGSL